ncbi:MAG: RidA family protein [Oscillospiraceae bacterium]|nr:RidA family protein [Oscillospiraceae bacterium]
MSLTEQKLLELGLSLPAPLGPSPLAEHLVFKQVDRWIFLSGTGPILEKKPAFRGRLVWTVRRREDRMKHEDGYEAARLAALNVISILKDHGVDLDRVEIVKITGYVAGDPDFYDQHMILNGASHLFNDVFGQRGAHVVTAVGCSSLPFDVPVILDVVCRLPEEEKEEAK